MTALSASRFAPRRGEHVDQGLKAAPAEASTICYEGGMVGLNAARNALPAGAAAALVIGVCETTTDNTTGAAGAKNVPVREGTFRMDNSGTHAVAKANIGGACYAEDDHTVGTSSLSSTLPYAGTIEDVDASGVWVKMRTDSASMTAPAATQASSISVLDADSNFDASSSVESALAQLAERRFDVIVSVAPADVAAGKQLVAGIAGKKIVVDGFSVNVGGATAWSGSIAHLYLQDDNGTPVQAADIAVAALAGNAVLLPSSANVTPKAGLATGFTTAKNLVAKSDAAAAAGSTLSVHVWGRIV